MTLYKNQRFANGETAFRGSYSPPVQCPSPWNKVVLDWWGLVDGLQTDRVGGLWMGSVEIFRTTTPLTQPSGAVWHVDKDVTEYSSILEANQTVFIMVLNYIGQSTPAPIYVNATLTFYEAGIEYPPAQFPQQIIGLNSGSNVPWFVMSNGNVSLSTNVSLTHETSRAYLEVFATPHSPCDEFWYALEVTSCNSGSPYREFRLFIDGRLSGIALPLPIMYSGAFNPEMWKPVPSILSMNVPAYNITLTPFIDVLADGKDHALTLQIFNYHDRWRVDANLLLYLGTSQFGSLTAANVASEPALNTNQMITGSIVTNSTSADDSIVVSRSVVNAQGETNTTTKEDIEFANTKTLDITLSQETIYQTQTFTTTTITSGADGNFTETLTDYFTLKTVFNVELPSLLAASADSTFSQTHSREVNGTLSLCTSTDMIQATTLGPTPIVEEETTGYTHSQSSDGGSLFCPTSTVEISTGRINVGVTGLEFVVVLALIVSFGTSDNRRRTLANILQLAGLLLLSAFLVLAYAKFALIANYRIGAASATFASSPELLMGSIGVLLLIGWAWFRRAEVAKVADDKVIDGFPIRSGYSPQ